jgi:hypothetical protein
MPRRSMRLCITRNRRPKTRISEATPQPDTSASAEVAGYVAAIANDLAMLSRRSGLSTLEYLLEMVRLEAETLNRKQPNGEPQP